MSSKFIKLSEYNNVKKDYTALREKLYDVWKNVINEGSVQVHDQRQKQNLAVLLENTRTWIKESSVGAAGYANNVGTTAVNGTGAFGNLHSLILPLVKRVFAKSNVIQKLVDTQPMLGPTGLAFGLRFQRGEFGEEGSLNKMREFGRPTSNRVSGSGLKLVYKMTLTPAVSATGVRAIADLDTLTVALVDSAEPDFMIDAAGTSVTLGPNAYGMKTVVCTNSTAGSDKLEDIEEIITVKASTPATYGWDLPDTLDLIIAAIPANFKPNVTPTTLPSKLNLVREAAKQNYPVDVAYASVLGKWKEGLFDNSNEIPGSTYDTANGRSARFSTMRVGVSSKSVTAGTRSIKTDWPIELEQDMRAVQNVSLEDVLVSTMEQMITLDIERELIAEMKNLAVDTLQGGENIFAITVDATANSVQGSWTQEKLSSLLTQLTVIAGRIKTATRLGRGNFAILSPSVATSLLSVSNFFSGLTISDNTSDDDNFVGRVNKLDIYEDVWGEIYDGENWDLNYTEAFIGFKGSKEGESGVIYMPYQPVQLLKAVDPASLQPVVAIKTRYSVMSKVIDSGAFYRGAIIKGLDTMLSLTNDWA